MGLIMLASWPHMRMRITIISLTATFTNHGTIDDVCAIEWKQADSLLGQDDKALPNCSDFQQENECQGIRGTMNVIVIF